MTLTIRTLMFFSLASLLWGQCLADDMVHQRPLSPGGGPTQVYCSFAVLDLDFIDDAKQNFTVNLYVNCRWHDPRLAHDAGGTVVKSLGEVWYPSLFFVNRQKLWSTWDNVVQVSPDGSVRYRQKFWGDFSQPMDLRDFPFDGQELRIKLMVADQYEYGEVLLLEDPKTPSFVVEELSIADWDIVDSSITSGPETLPTGEQAAMMMLTITAERIVTNYLIKSIAPLLLILALSWVVFWLDPEDVGQLGVAVTTCLTVIAYHLALSSRLPRIPYLTHLDVFVFGATILVFLAMAEVVTTTRLARTGRLERARSLDRVCRFVFPFLLMSLVLYAFVWR